MATMLVLRAVLLVTLTFLNLVNGEQSYCSSTNLGSHFVTTYMYMSNGYCSDACRSAGYSIAIVQYQSCWCSDSVPEDTVSVSNCDVACPGYAQELCGNSDEGLYGYIVVSDGYSTVGSSTTQSTEETTSATSTTSSTTHSSQESTQQSTQQTTQDTTEQTTSSSSSSSTSTSSTSTSSTSRSTTPSTSTLTSTPPASTETTSLAPVTSIVYSVMTVTGSATTALTTTQVISTIISVPSQTASSASTSASSSTSSGSGDGFFDSTGKVAGVFTVVGVVCAALIGGLVFLCLRHRRHSQDDHMSDEEDGMSHQDEKVPRPILTPDEFEDNGHGEVVEVDQRLDPRQMMFMNWESGSRQSLADDVDYSRRVLRVTNE